MSLSFRFSALLYVLIIIAGFVFYTEAAGTCCTIVITSNLDTDFVITSDFPDFTNYPPQTFIKKDAVRTPSFTPPAGKYLWEIHGAFPRAYTIRVNAIPGYEALYTKTFTIPEGYDYFTSNIAINYTASASVSPPSSSLESLCSGTASIDETAEVPPGGIVVSSNAMGAKFTITGPATYSAGGAAWYKQNALLGTYTTTWSPIAGCETPPPETKTLQTGKWIGFVGNYKDSSLPKGYGAVEIKTNLTNQITTFLIQGPEQKTMKGTSASWLSAPAGSYTVTYGEIPNFVRLDSETKTLEAGGVINFYGYYKPVEPYKELFKKIESPASQVTPQEAKDELQTAEKTISKAPSASPSPAPKPPRSIFFRFLNSISSFFRKLF